MTSAWHVNDDTHLAPVRTGDHHLRFVLLEEARPPMKRALTLKNVAKSAGTIVLCLLALDLVATLITLVIGAEFLKR
ncbi:MAG TPA: hypothetical protein VE968_05535 [Sphingomicrobium sp.]|nr:hypothetical protein [Sphingomicrobium sp.]